LAGFVLVGEDFNQPLAICVNPTPIPHKYNTAEQTPLDHETAKLPHQVELIGDLGSSGIFHSTNELAYRSRWPHRRRKTCSSSWFAIRSASRNRLPAHCAGDFRHVAGVADKWSAHGAEADVRSTSGMCRFCSLMGQGAAL
jgi:hypothetical protein